MAEWIFSTVRMSLYYNKPPKSFLLHLPLCFMHSDLSCTHSVLCLHVLAWVSPIPDDLKLLFCPQYLCLFFALPARLFSLRFLAWWVQSLSTCARSETLLQRCALHSPIPMVSLYFTDFIALSVSNITLCIALYLLHSCLSLTMNLLKPKTPFLHVPSW